MSRIRSYRDLVVWRKSTDLSQCVYRLVQLLPPEEKYELGSQMRRACVSISCNIAEGAGKRTTKDFINFLSMAKGSDFEVGNQLILGERIGYFTPEQTQEAKQLCFEIECMLNSLMVSLRRKIENGEAKK